MLLNDKNQIVTLSNKARKICDEGLAAIQNEIQDHPSIKARANILRPLKEVLCNTNPAGRGLNGMFSLGERARFMPNTNSAF